MSTRYSSKIRDTLIRKIIKTIVIKLKENFILNKILAMLKIKIFYLKIYIDIFSKNIF